MFGTVTMKLTRPQAEQIAELLVQATKVKQLDERVILKVTRYPCRPVIVQVAVEKTTLEDKEIQDGQHSGFGDELAIDASDAARPAAADARGQDARRGDESGDQGPGSRVLGFHANGADHHSGIEAENPHWPGQPAPLGPPPTGDAQRPLLANFRWEGRWVANEKLAKSATGEKEKELIEFRVLAKRSCRETLLGEDLERFERLKRDFEAKLTHVQVALNSDEIYARAAKELRGWPMLMSNTWLFVDQAKEDGSVSIIADVADFRSLIVHGYFRPQFVPGQDVDCVNFASIETLFCDFRKNARNWGIVERYPHFPPFKNHYYTWRPPVGYVATGEHLAAFLRFFDNIQDATSRAIFAGAALTMFSGIHYGQRPLFIHDADMPGSGKSSAAVQIGKLAGNMVMTDLSRKSEDQLLTRLLSPLGMELRGILWDNIDTIFKSALACQIITADPDISAHRMREGEGRRPANLVCFASLNAARVDTDIGRRCFITFFKKPDKPSAEIAAWLTRLTTFIETNVKFIQADCVHILSRPMAELDLGDSRGETFSVGRYRFWGARWRFR